METKGSAVLAKSAPEARCRASFARLDLCDSLEHPGFLVRIEPDGRPVVVLDERQTRPLRKPCAGSDRPLEYASLSYSHTETT